MSLNFPSQPEVRLKKPPLSEVICQVRFPPILRIGSESPVNFQDVIRKRFPGLEVERQVLVHLGISPSVDNPIAENAPKVYRFKSADEKSSVALASDFFALSTNSYSHWRNFVDDFHFVEQAVRKEFQPSLATRVGLRFINRLTQKNTGCKTFSELLDLLRGELTCLIRSEAWRDPSELLTQIVLPDQSAKLILRFGFGREQDEPFFLLDFDYFEDFHNEFTDIAQRIEHYHDQIYQAFRWCIKDGALDRFEPVIGK